MPDPQDPRPDPVDIPAPPEPHVRGEDAFPGATTEPTMGMTVSPGARAHHGTDHHDDPGGTTGPHPALWIAAAMVAVLVVVLLLVLLD